MKNIQLFLGRIGSGKSYIARLQQEVTEKIGKETFFIEVSELVEQFAKRVLKKENPSRTDLQGVKDKMKKDPNWLLNMLIEKIESTPNEEIFVSGLREKWIYDILVQRYDKIYTYIIQANAELRRKRRDLTQKQFLEAEERDDQIGLKDLLAAVKSKAVLIINEHEKKMEVLNS